MQGKEAIENEVREFLAREIGEEIRNAPVTEKLISSRMINSITVLKMVNYLEEKFGIEFEAHDVDQDNLDTIERIVEFVRKKMS